MTQARQRVFATVLLGAGLFAGAAFGGVASLLGDLVDPATAYAGFLGAWSHRDAGASDIDRVIVTEGGSTHVRMQVFGRCENVICNWGVQSARVRAERPDIDTVRSITADYNLGYALRRVTLHKAPGGALSYDVVTEFTDGSDRHDYESIGRLMATDAAAAAPATAAPGAVPAIASYSGSPSASAVGSVQENCLQFDGGKAYVTRDDSGGWQIRDFLHPVLRLGPNRAAAFAAMKIVSNYRFDEVCFVGRDRGQMTYWRSAGEIARTPMPQQDCTEVHSAKVQAVQRGEDWKVVDGDIEIYDYGEDRAGADQAALVIRTYALNRQCFFARPDSRTHYWLAL